MNIYVSNLAFQVGDDELKSLFGRYGNVASAKVITDRETGRSRGFAFVEMAEKEGQQAMKEADGSHIEGRTISVAVAKPKTGGSNGSYSNERSSRW
jgi:RNA recognition motif-containing protein